MDRTRLALTQSPPYSLCRWSPPSTTPTGPRAATASTAPPGTGQDRRRASAAGWPGGPSAPPGCSRRSTRTPARIAAVTSERGSAFRAADGDLRRLPAARDGCAFDPACSARTDRVRLLAQPCRDRDSWSQEPAAVDGLGKITPGRTPLGNELPGERPTDRGGNRVARPS
ncbi:hypothetical protein [Streptomyces violascens]|uniref:hypothetical protein n=1 Tax=Streptomyces violascens TaxID=67381 RepID=UPI003693D82B